MAVARLDDVSTWPNGKLVLVGPEGSGKTHLGHVWAEAVRAAVADVGALPGMVVPEITTPMVLEVPASMTAEEEEALFHFHNHMVAQQHPFLLLARTPPAQWPIKLPDLKSRMEATDSVRIAAPDDALLSAVLVKQFADRQLEVAPNVIAYLTRHMPRSFADAERVVAELDKAALAEGRAVTRPLAKRVLDTHI